MGFLDLNVIDTEGTNLLQLNMTLEVLLGDKLGLCVKSHSLRELGKQ